MTPPDLTRRTSGVWTRALGVTLVATTAERVAEQAALVRALTDGHDRAGAPVMPEVPAAAEWFEVREGGATVGVAIVQRHCPRKGAAALLAVATAREGRGRSTAAKALLAAERRLAAEGYTPMLARVPRTNGRGLYFMLRCGFTPVTGDDRPQDEGDATWFAREAKRSD